MSSFDYSIKLAHAAMRRSDYQAARDAAQTAVFQNERSVEAWWIIGTASVELDDMDAAQNAFGRAASYAPAHSKLRAQMLAQRGKPLMSEGRMAEAVNDAREAFKSKQLDTPDLIRLGLP